MRILAVNPGSTSTKVGLFEDDTPVFVEKTVHDVAALGAFKAVADQLEFRTSVVRAIVAARGVVPAGLAAVAARGGLLRPLEGGTYRVNGRMLVDLKAGVMGEHASNLGGLIAEALTRGTDIPAYIVDPVVVDELVPEARVTGVPEIKRNSIFHALNQKAAARSAARRLDKRYGDVNLVVAHLGGGISVGAHCRGRVIDVNDALYGDGPMAPERAGRVPPYAFAALAAARGWDDREMRRRLAGQGGMVAHLGTHDMTEVEARARAGDEKAALVYAALIHQVAREIGAMAAVLKGRVDAVVITGGLAHSVDIIRRICEYTAFLGRIIVMPGE